MDRLKQACQEKISGVIIPELDQKIGAALSGIGKWEIRLDPDDPDNQTVLFAYPSAIENGKSGYVQPVVKIELGARSDHWPVEAMTVKPYVSNAAGKVIIEGAQVRVLGAERTFWEVRGASPKVPCLEQGVRKGTGSCSILKTSL